ncbi:hypothetical protein [Parafrankia sp. FMc2]|uniref:hypothetical protein n=1 Tax=Parafrankia sp. FMc2 TaxID=3233196 RepID=UPI0034D76BD6
MGVRRTVLASMLAAVLGSSLLAGCAGLESTTAGDGAASTDQQPPAGSCGGPVETVQDVEVIISEPAGCPGSVNTYWAGELGGQWTRAPSKSLFADQADDLEDALGSAGGGPQGGGDALVPGQA